MGAGLDPDLERAIRGLNNQGYTRPEIAAELGISVTKVTYWGRQLQLPQVRPRIWREAPVHSHGGYLAMWLPPDDPMYVMAMKSGYALQHRLVMARSLGRPLSQHETVHHINGVKDDNRLENLQLRQGPHGKGAVFTCLDCGSHNVDAKQLA